MRVNRLHVKHDQPETLEPNLARGRALQLRSPDHSDHLAQVVQDFANQLKLTRYSFFLQDYVGPIGFRMANAHPEMIDAIVFQNANAYEVGLSPLWPVRRAFWEDRPAHEA